MVISDDLKYRINKKEYSVGEKLPSERELALEYKVHRQSVNEALNILILEGVIEVVPRQGSFVRDKKIKKTNRKIQTVANCINESNRDIRIIVSFFESSYVNKKYSDKLLKDIGTPVYIYQRLIFMDDKLVAIEKTTVLKKVVPNLNKNDVACIDTYSMYKEKHSLNVSRSEKRLRMIYSNQEENDILGIYESQHLFKEEGLIFLDNDQILEYVEYILLPEYFEYTS